MADELHLSDAVGDVCCARCHSAATPPASPAALIYRPPAPPPPPKPSPYAVFVDDIWTGLARRTGHLVHYVDANTIAAYCPACRTGTLAIVFVDERPPRLILRSELGLGSCSLGCTTEQIREALKA